MVDSATVAKWSVFHWELLSWELPSSNEIARRFKMKRDMHREIMLLGTVRYGNGRKQTAYVSTIGPDSAMASNTLKPLFDSVGFG